MEETQQTPVCFAIKDWDKHFENSESRKIKSLTWLPVKNKHDGKGYRRVVSHPKSIQVFCAWNLIIQVASKMPVRGLLRDEDGPLTTSDLSMKTGFPESIFEEAIKVLSDPKIGWLEQSPPGNVRGRREVSGDAGTEWNGTEGNRTEWKGGDPPREIPDENQAVAMCMNAGIDEKFIRFAYTQWNMQSGKNANGVPVEWMRYVTGRWKNEQTEWRNGTHRGTRKTAPLERERLKESLQVKTL